MLFFGIIGVVVKGWGTRGNKYNNNKITFNIKF